ncbi:MAG: ribose-5-phosphate isomerase RpiA [Alphaproteobacteria bacterium]|nr:ribose-5-phosphate isomerase RpiA [Alphaproteobacteria bacterium]MDE2111869.1 ribose-5-phosphate isomerase RpiA [Alphaproteobacteria bacterium]MDE2493609.1 ribose-5-phosphate isomerase RpiA [Alphaproteobacteria bacterium]
MTDSDPAALKRAAAARALDFVADGMKLGLGSGSTSEAFHELLAVRVRGGLNVVGVPTSERVAQLARGLGIVLAKLDDIAPLDLTIDGADEADRDLNVIKGGGAALLREKIVASSSKKMVIIADGSKLVNRLGRFPLPVEVVEFGHETTAARIVRAVAALGYSKVPLVLRKKNGAPVKTDGGNLLYDCGFGAVADAAKLDAALSSVTGVVEHGLFVGIASTLVIAGPGGVEIIERST